MNIYSDKWIHGFILSLNLLVTQNNTLQKGHKLTLPKGNLDDRILSQNLKSQLVIHIKRIPLEDGLDRLKWTLENNGCFSIKNAYKSINPNLIPLYIDTQSLYNAIWVFSSIIPKEKLTT